MICELEHKIFTSEDTEFEELALGLFQFQYSQNAVYREYVQLLAINSHNVTSLDTIPFLPIGLFKSHRVSTSSREEAVFESSGTTQVIPARHFVSDLSIYYKSFTTTFEDFYGPASEWCILGLLPSYLERKNSSLVAMVNRLIQQSGHPDSGFYLHDHAALSTVIQRLESTGQKTILIGVTFALLDFAEKFSMPLQHTIVMETGGMKGRREEMTRDEVHEILKTAWSLDEIHSEYGMTELLSQAYSKGEGVFISPPWMKIFLREEDDPLRVKHRGRGLINVVDLANIYSCPFIATDDVGLVHSNGSFEVLGRTDNSDLRGCSLMTEYL